jgi:hypothetical protein
MVCTLQWGLARKDTSFTPGPMVPEFLLFFFFFFFFFFYMMVHNRLLIKKKNNNIVSKTFRKTNH